MHLALTFINTLLPVLSLAGKTHQPSALRSRHFKYGNVGHEDVATVKRSVNVTVSQSGSVIHRSTNPPYNVETHYEGEDFFKYWNFEVESDPTHGSVIYQSQEQAVKKRLAYVQNEMIVLSVDTNSIMPSSGKRDSVRISSQKKWDRGLFIADIAFMPYGCGVWPAYWSVNSENWPGGGEIDIIEGVNNQQGNQYTLHTGIPCALPSDGRNLDASSNLISYDCQTHSNDNRGCAFLDPDISSYGAGFNAAGGGVVAHEWNEDHIRVWIIPRNRIPGDIKAQKPNPTSWGEPSAEWSSKYCDIEKATFQHSLVFDITLCGDWANGVYPQSGCPDTCQQFIANSSNLQNAKWGINSITVYQS